MNRYHGTHINGKAAVQNTTKLRRNPYRTTAEQRLLRRQQDFDNNIKPLIGRPDGITEGAVTRPGSLRK